MESPLRQISCLSAAAHRPAHHPATLAARAGAGRGAHASSLLLLAQRGSFIYTLPDGPAHTVLALPVLPVLPVLPCCRLPCDTDAGIYCPMLAEQIMNRGGVNLQGLAVGNGCWGNKIGTASAQSLTWASACFGHSYARGRPNALLTNRNGTNRALSRQ